MGFRLGEKGRMFWFGEFPWCSVWVPGVPSKGAFFAWTTTFGRVLTINNLICRHHTLVNWCYMCCVDAEIVDHLLIHCPFASHLWVLIFSLFGVVWIQPKQVKEVLRCWGGG
ncbi:hypothetical protein CsSME_00025748 [Camellia sinensis var. sinensis]